MTGLRKTIWGVSAFVIVVGITFVVMGLRSAMGEYERQRVESNENQEVLKEVLELQKKELEERGANKERHWIEERIEQEGAATEERIREQEAQGDDLKNEFEKFAK